MGTVEDCPRGMYPCRMKYQHLYDQIIVRARTRKLDIYKETHHVLPRSLGGSDDPANLVDLTYREHFLVHWVLTKIYKGYEHRLMAYALHCMTFDIRGVRGVRLVAGWQHEVAKRSLKLIALETLERRLALLRSEGKLRRVNIETRAARVLVDAHSLDPSRKRDRAALTKMSKEWLRFYPKWSRRKQRKRGYPRPQVAASP